MRWTTRRLVVVGLVIGLVLGSVASPVLALLLQPSDTAKFSDGVPLGAPDGLNVTVYGDVNVSAENMFPDSRTVRVNTTDGNVTLAADNTASASIYPGTNVTGTWTNVSDISAGATWIEVHPSDKQRVDVRGDTDRLAIRSMTLDDGTTDFRINGTDGGTGTVKIYDLTANTQIAAVDEDTNTFLDSNTSDSNGNLTLDIPLSAHNVELQTADPDAPIIDQPDPTGLQSTSPDELSVRVRDQDFASDQDEVTVTFRINGNQIEQKTIQSNQTLTADVSQEFDLGEVVDWNVSAVDSYGLSDTSNNTFNIAQAITIRNETNATQLITGENVTATFYSENGEIVTKRTDTDNDGQINLTGLPNTAFVVTFDGDGWHDRRAYVESIGGQQNIYLLNSTAYPLGDDSAIQTTFVYEDRTGAFEQANTTLEIERAVDPDGDGNFTWQVVAGDYWGAAGEFPFIGEYQARYRLRITNRETGEERLLGTHLPTADGVKNIIIGKVIFEAENATGRYIDAGINESTSNLQIYYNDPTNSTTGLEIVVYEQGNQSNELYNNTVAGPVGEVVISQALTGNETDTNWVVTFNADDTADGPRFNKVIVGGGSYPLPVDGDILSAASYLMITFVMALYGPRTALFGAWAGVFAFGAFAFLGWISGVTVAVPILIALGATFYNEAMP